MNSRFSYFVAVWFTWLVLFVFNDAVNLTPYVAIGLGIASALAIGVHAVAGWIVGKMK